MLRVTRFDPLSGHRLRVGFNDGLVREVDCSFLLHGTLGEPLRDPDYFRRAETDKKDLLREAAGLEERSAATA